ncbi:MAG: hypothetical protein ACPGLV_16635, partial [Bacteroidia bacterium]
MELIRPLTIMLVTVLTLFFVSSCNVQKSKISPLPCNTFGTTGKGSKAKKHLFKTSKKSIKSKMPKWKKRKANVQPIYALNTVSNNVKVHSAPKLSLYKSAALKSIERKIKDSKFQVLPTVKSRKKHSLNNENYKTMIASNVTIEPLLKSTLGKEKGKKKVLSAKRKNGILIGASILLMAVLAAISFPVLGSLTATLGLIGIFILDIIVSIGIYKYFKEKTHILAKTSAAFRMIYTGFLGAGIASLIAGGGAVLFNTIWGFGLIGFGVHLITLGILYNNEGGKKWVNIAVKSLLILAGIGYLIQYVGILFVASPIAFAATVNAI